MLGVILGRAALMLGVSLQQATLMRLARIIGCGLGIFALALASGQPHAQEVQASSQQLRLAGTAPSACVLSAPSIGSATNASFAVTGASSAQIAITQLVDPQTAVSLASTIELNLPVTCNASNTITLRTANGGLRRVGAAAGQTAASGGFAEFLGYRLGVDWAGQSLDQASTAGTATIASSQPGRGTMVLRVATAAGTGPLVAGRYDDSIIIEFHAAN